MNKLIKYSLPVGTTVLLSMGAITPAFADNTTVIAGTAGVGLQNFTDLGEATSSSLMDLSVILKLNNQSQFLGSDLILGRLQKHLLFEKPFVVRYDESFSSKTLLNLSFIL